MSEALRRKFPKLTLEHLPLGDFPTPVAELALPEGGRVWVKREDLASSLYGGNKLRKLEWLLPAARARGGLLSIGAVGSNYLVACALHGGLHGVPLDAVLFPQPATEHARENARVLASGARLWPVQSELYAPWAAWKALRAISAEGRPRPLMVWAGGSSALGSLGWVSAALELKEQIDRGELPEPTDLVVTLGSGGTVAGLLLGLRIAGLKTRLHAIRVVDALFANRHIAAWLARGSASLLRRHGAEVPEPDAAQLVVHDAFFGPGYGHPTPAGSEAIGVARELGLGLDPTYTGKTFAAVLEGQRKGWFGEHVLFVNTLSAARPPAAQVTLPPAVEALLLP